MQTLLGSDAGAGRFTFRPHLLAADELASVDRIGALFIVPAAVRAGASAAAAAQRLHVPVLSTDIACAQAGYCSLSFSSAPTVEIMFNRGAAQDAGVHFTPAFRMLVKKL